MSGLEKMFDEIRSCTKCLFDIKKDVRYCGGVGTDYRAVFIAESPSTAGGTGIKSNTENFRRKGASKLFDDIRKKFGLENCYVTDLVKCGVAAGKPDQDKVDNCLTYLREEIQAIKPQLIVAVGKTLKLDDNSKPFRFSEFLQKTLEIEIPIFETWHYSYLWNRCQLKKELRRNPEIPEILPDKLAEYERQHEVIQAYLENRIS